MSEDVKKVTNLEDAEVDGINPSLDAGATKLDPENINQDLEDLGLPELPPEVIAVSYTHLALPTTPYV